MQYRRLGQAGVHVSAIGLGTNRFGSEKVPQKAVSLIIGKALDLGINFLDTSNNYNMGRSEETLGVALRGRRDEFVIATKVWAPVGEGPNDRGTSRYHIVRAVEDSLRRLRTDHIDLYYAHRWDDQTPIDETLRALDDLVRTGKVLYIGASAYASWQLAHANLLAETRGWTRFVVIQSHYHLLERDVEREVLPYCQRYQVGFVPYYPLAGGFLTGKYRHGQRSPAGSRGETSSYVQSYMNKLNYERLEQLTAWATQRGRKMNELAIAWLLAQPQICSVIAGATGAEQLIANAKASDWALDEEHLSEIDAVIL